MEQINIGKLDDIQLVTYLAVINYQNSDFIYHSQWMEQCYKWMKSKREEEEQKKDKK